MLLSIGICTRSGVHVAHAGWTPGDPLMLSNFITAFTHFSREFFGTVLRAVRLGPYVLMVHSMGNVIAWGLGTSEEDIERFTSAISRVRAELKLEKLPSAITDNLMKRVGGVLSKALQADIPPPQRELMMTGELAYLGVNPPEDVVRYIERWKKKCVKHEKKVLKALEKGKWDWSLAKKLALAYRYLDFRTISKLNEKFGHPAVISLECMLHYYAPFGGPCMRWETIKRLVREVGDEVVRHHYEAAYECTRPDYPNVAHLKDKHPLAYITYYRGAPFEDEEDREWFEFVKLAGEALDDPSKIKKVLDILGRVMKENREWCFAAYNYLCATLADALEDTPISRDSFNTIVHILSRVLPTYLDMISETRFSFLAPPLLGVALGVSKRIYDSVRDRLDRVVRLFTIHYLTLKDHPVFEPDWFYYFLFGLAVAWRRYGYETPYLWVLVRLMPYNAHKWSPDRWPRASLYDKRRAWFGAMYASLACFHIADREPIPEKRRRLKWEYLVNAWSAITALLHYGATPIAGPLEFLRCVRDFWGVMTEEQRGVARSWVRALSEVPLLKDTIVQEEARRLLEELA